MLKAAFIANSESQNPQTYSLRYENPDFQLEMVAVSGMDMTKETILGFARDGFDLVDLCGDFTQEMAEALRQATGNQIRISAAVYSEEEAKKLEALTTMQNYGIILMGRGIGSEPVWLEKKNQEFNTQIAIVGSDAMAAEAAREMAEAGIDFIELCGYFDQEKAAALSQAAGGALPVGYCC